uniref:N-alpha-acetyltransferase 15, NatA auxiliary subunit-like n=1 Tax=Hirondellea gigas TaxID=1518452 RepID=A0A2P2HYW5_9CRUS
MDASNQQLPTKENALFKRILKCYEQKQYKNGLKFAKQILQNFPNHGETQAMKGLTMNCLGRKEEAYQLVRLGLRNNLRSHVCWHVFGLLQRSDKKYDEAIKCYRNALKWDKDNLQILRDLSLLQIQMRDLEGYRETRYKLFELRPTHRASWIGYAMSFHLLKDYSSALKIIEEFRKTMQKNTYDYEYSELLLYQNMVMREAGLYEEALQHLNTYKTHICDKVTSMELRGELYLRLDQPKEAEKFYRTLIKRNPENMSYYLKLEEALQLTTVDQKLALYKEYTSKFPRAHVPRRLPLNYATGETLVTLLEPYLQKSLLKGVPPLFTDILSLYDQPDKTEIVEKLMYKYLHNLETSGRLNPDDEDCEKEPACILFVLMFLAEHHSHHGESEKALSLLQRALDHTPTLIELYIIKGAILKHAGDLLGAVDAVTEAQTLDTADRYVNSKSASYMLAANMVQPAQEMCSKFTREGVSAMENLNEMQCMWFQNDCAHAYYRLGQYGQALKMCHQVDRHFTEIIEDQFDFHTYCMRKMTLRSYMQLLRLEDVLRSNEFFWRASSLAITIYLRLHDKPITDVSVENDINTANMTPFELKKYRAKQRKTRKVEERKQEEKRKEDKKAEQKKKAAGQDDLENPPQEELIPYKLERPAEPLTEALYFLRPLQALLPNRLQTHLFAFNIHLRRDKPMLMLQSLKRAHSVDKQHPELHTCSVQFLRYCKESLPRKYQQPPPTTATVLPTQTDNKNNPANNHHQNNNKQNTNKGRHNNKDKNNKDKNQQRKNNHQQNNSTDAKSAHNSSNKDVTAPKVVNYEEEEAIHDEQERSLMECINKEIYNMFGTMDPHTLNESFLNDNSESAPHRLQAARSMFVLDEVQKERAINIATELSDRLTNRTLKTLQSVMEWLQGLECQASPEQILHYKTQCQKLFPRAQVFITETPPDHTTTLTTTTATCSLLTTTTSASSGAIPSVGTTEDDEASPDEGSTTALKDERVTINCDSDDVKDSTNEVIANHVNHVAT